jgi:hypothetical protein
MSGASCPRGTLAVEGGVFRVLLERGQRLVSGNHPLDQGPILRAMSNNLGARTSTRIAQSPLPEADGTCGVIDGSASIGVVRIALPVHRARRAAMAHCSVACIALR